MKNQSVLFLSMIVIMLAATPSRAQERIKEAGLSFQNFDGFGLNYKTGTSAALWRFNSAYASGYSQTESLSSNSENEQKIFGFGFQVGREYRNPIIDNLELRLGFDLGFNWSHQKNETTFSDESFSRMKRNTYGPRVNGVIGLNYVVKEKLVIGAEVMPGVGYTFGTTKEKTLGSEEVERDLSGWNFSLSNSAAMLTLAYRFTKS